MLFEPITVGSLQLKNRIVMAPMATNFGVRSDQAITYYVERAKGGVGLVIVQALPVDRFESGAFVSGIAKLADAIHQAGAKAAVQLWHGNMLPSGEPVAPSATDSMREMTVTEIKDAAQRFALAAAKAKEAGYDTVNIHGAHGYYIQQFFSPHTNKRTDEYGGTLENRMRFPLEIVAAMRVAVGSHYPIMYRHSAKEYYPDGITLEDTVIFAQALDKAEVDIIDISTGPGSTKTNYTIPKSNLPMATHADLAASVKKVVSHAKVLAVGRMNTGAVAEAVLAEGKADLVAIARQLLTDPYWPQKVAEGREDEIRACISCNKLCSGNQQNGTPISCIKNPLVGREWEVANGTLSPEDVAALFKKVK